MGFGLAVTVIIAAAVPIALCVILLKICRRNEHQKNSRLVALFSTFDVPLRRFGGSSNTRLALVSCLGLFLEMLLINWISSELSLLGYFKNFVLIACFLGFGIGCYLSKRNIRLSCFVFPLLFVSLAVGLQWPSVALVRALLIETIGSASSMPFLGGPSAGIGIAYAMGLLAAVILFAIPFFTLVVFTFVPIGQMVGALIEQSGKDGVRAYSLNVAAGLAGIIAYTVLCFMAQPPAVWLSAAALITVCLVWRLPSQRWLFFILFAVIIAATSYAPPSTTATYWSPYQKLKITPHHKSGELVSYSLTTNNSWYQQVINLSDPFVERHPELLGKNGVAYNLYNIPYHFYSHPPSALILGSGMGNDVAAALRNGAERVVAVEIDPVILKLGRMLHFEKPYDDPRVTVINDDARTYIQKSKERFSLIIFSLLDAQITGSHYSNIRIDNYVYTVEALRAAKKLLAPDGVCIIKFQVDHTHWIAGRLQRLVATVFGQKPLEIQSEAGAYSPKGRFFIAGSKKRIEEALRDSIFNAYAHTHSHSVIQEVPVTTDDWPFFYQRTPGIPGSVIILSLVLFVCIWFLLRRLGLSRRRIQWHFFFLGAGFMLLEVQAVSKMALLFGATWIVNSFVVGGIMILIVCANLLVEKFRTFPLPWAYVGIGVTMALSYVIPLRFLFVDAAWLKTVLAALLLLSPVFFASIVFIRSYATGGFKGEALGANLLGALAGGLLESISLWTGLRSLLIIALAMYLASYLSLRFGRQLHY